MIKILTFVYFTLLFFIVFVSYEISDKNAKYSEGKVKQSTTVRFFGKLYYVIMLSSFALLVAYGFTDLLSGFVLHQNNVLMLLGMLVSFLGLILFNLAKRHLDNNYSPCDNPYLPHTVVKKGVYSLCRHPIYLATSTMFLGVAVTTGLIILFVNYLILIFVQIKSALDEEKALLNAFPDYQTYTKSTPMILPNFTSFRRAVNLGGFHA